MSECKHEKSQECSGKKSKGNRSQDNSPERPKIGLLPIPIVTKEVLLPKPVLSKEGLLPVPVLSKEDILADVSKTGILADVLKPSPDLSKVAITELTKVIKDKVSPKIIEVISTEVVSKRTGLCKRCEGKEEAEKIAPRGGSLISNAPLGDGILNLLPNPLGLLKPDDSQNAVVTNGKVHNNENGKGNDNKPGQGIGFLPQPPHISIPFLPGEKNGIPGATDIFNPINLKPGNVIPDPTNLVKTFLGMYYFR